MKGGALWEEKVEAKEDAEWMKIVDSDETVLSKIFGTNYTMVNTSSDTELNKKLLEKLSEPLDENQLSKLSRPEKVVLIIDREKDEEIQASIMSGDDIIRWEDRQQRLVNAVWRKFRDIKKTDIQASRGQASRGQAVGAAGGAPEGVGGGRAKSSYQPPVKYDVETGVWGPHTY